MTEPSSVTLPPSIDELIEQVIDAAMTVGVATGARQVASADKVLRSALSDLRREIAAHLGNDQASA